MERGSGIRNQSYLRLEAPIPPITNHRLMPVNGRMVKTKVNRQYTEKVRELLFLNQIKPFFNDVLLEITWFRENRRGDVPDRWKCLCDALQSKDNYGFGMYVDDKQIADFRARRIDDKTEKPRVEVICWNLSSI